MADGFNPTTTTGTTIRFFISSTFADFQIERDVLQRRAFPELRQMCARSGFRLQPIDLRWGVSEEASTARQTLRICFDELERCRQLSPDFFQLILLGDRYGTHPLSPDVPADVIARLLPHLSPEERQTFEDTYRLDENADPPAYVLLRARGPERAGDEALRQALVRAGSAAGLSDGECLPFEASATHREIQLGLLGVQPDASNDRGVLCAVRRFTGNFRGVNSQQYAEHDNTRSAAVRRLTEAVVRRLPGEQVMSYEVEWRGQRGPAFDSEVLAQHYLRLLRPRIEAVIAARTAARAVAEAQGRNAADFTNARFAAERVAHFVGREKPLAAIAAYLDAPTEVPLVVAGPGGVGKSTLLVKALEHAMAFHPEALVLARYSGVTPGAFTLPALLDNVCAELAGAYAREVVPVREDSERSEVFRAALGWATADRPLILVLDALDQLGPPPLAMEWIPTSLPPHVHLVVSLLDEKDRLELPALAARKPAVRLVSLDRMDMVEGDALLSAWLSEAHRTLTPAQRATVLGAFGSEGRPLYLKLAFEEARQWRSFDALADLPHLDETIPGILQARFVRLERPDEHGPELTSHTVGLLAAAKNGLAEDELLAVLARDEVVRAELRTMAPHSPPIEPRLPLPAILWARLYADLAPYLSEREVDQSQTIVFYHRQVIEAVTARYMGGNRGPEWHRRLAAYFLAEPATYKGDQRVLPNRRKLSELPYQLAGARMRRQLLSTLTDGMFLERKLRYQGVQPVVADLGLYPSKATEVIAQVVRAGALVLARGPGGPGELSNQMRGRTGSIKPLHYARGRHRGFQLVSRSLGPADPALEHILYGHKGGVTGCVFSADGRFLLSCSADHTLVLWSVETGAKILTFRGHSGSITCAVFSPDGKSVASSSDDGILHVWDSATGEVLQTVTVAKPSSCVYSPDSRYLVSASEDAVLRVWDARAGYTLVKQLDTRIEAVKEAAKRAARAGYSFTLDDSEPGGLRIWAFSPDGRYVLTTYQHLFWLNKTALAWDLSAESVATMFQGGDDNLLCAAWSPDGKVVIAGDRGGRLEAWDAKTGERIRRFKTRSDHQITCCAISPNGRLIAGGSDDGSIYMRSRGKRLQVRHFAGHTSWVSSCTFSPDNRLLATSSYDGSIRIWRVGVPRKLRSLWQRLRVVSEVKDCAISPDGRMAMSITEDGTALLWGVKKSRPVRRLAKELSNLSSCLFSPNGQHAAVVCQMDMYEMREYWGRGPVKHMTVLVWPIRSYKPMRAFWKSLAYALLFLYIRPWSRDTLREGFLNAIRRVIADGMGGPIGAWLNWMSWKTGRSLVGRDSSSSDNCSASFSQDGRLLLAPDGDGRLALWTFRSGKRITRYSLSTVRSTARCALSPDGAEFLTARWNTLCLHTTATGKKVREFEGHDKMIIDVAFSPNGRQVASASEDGTIRVWDAASSQEILVARHGGPVRRCAFSPDGQFILSAADDGVLSLHSIATGRHVAAWLHDKRLTCCAYGPDGRTVLAGDSIGRVHFLRVPGGGA